jgi:hypothetical protein
LKLRLESQKRNPVDEQENIADIKNGYKNENKDMIRIYHTVHKISSMREIPWNESKFIVASSALFLLPAYSFYCCGQILLCTGLCVTSLVSMNYWRDARKNSWRRQLDLVVAKIAFVNYFCTGIYNVSTVQDYQRYIPISIVLGGCYYLSDKLSRTEILDKLPGSSHYWIIAHVMFHFMLTTNLFHIAELVCS